MSKQPQCPHLRKHGKKTRPCRGELRILCYRGNTTIYVCKTCGERSERNSDRKKTKPGRL